jgi:hypothetical protein
MLCAKELAKLSLICASTNMSSKFIAETPKTVIPLIGPQKKPAFRRLGHQIRNRRTPRPAKIVFYRHRHRTGTNICLKMGYFRRLSDRRQLRTTLKKSRTR